MNKWNKKLPDKPVQVTTIEYQVRYILKAQQDKEVVFVGNVKECADYLGVTKRSFRNGVRLGRIKADGKYYSIDRIKYKERVVLTGEERRRAKKNAEYAKQYRDRKKRSRLGFNERERIP